MDGEHQRNPADLPLVTLDNNALIALRDEEEDAPAVRQLLDLHRSGLINVCVTMSTAMEAQRPEERLEWQDHVASIESLGIPRENIFTHPRSVGFMTPGAPDTITFSPWLENALVERIYTILFPTMPFIWHEYRHRETVDLTLTEKQALLELEELRFHGTWIPPRPTPALDALTNDEREQVDKRLEDLDRTWFNAQNDAHGFYIHFTSACATSHLEHAVFVTSDRNFRKQTKLKAIRALNYRGEILPPAEAVAFLYTVTKMRDDTAAGSKSLP
jgi:hypothetical protein